MGRLKLEKIPAETAKTIKLHFCNKKLDQRVSLRDCYAKKCVLVWKAKKVN